MNDILDKLYEGGINPIEEPISRRYAAIMQKACGYHEKLSVRLDKEGGGVSGEIPGCIGGFGSLRRQGQLSKGGAHRGQAGAGALEGEMKRQKGDLSAV